VLKKNKSTECIDGCGAGRIKKFLSGDIKNPNGVPLSDFNALGCESKVTCLKLCPEFKERILRTTGLGENAEDDEIIEALKIREHSENWARNKVKGLRKQQQMYSAFNKLDNETQLILASDGNLNDKIAAINGKIESGAVDRNSGEFLRKLVEIDRICRDQEAGFITKQEAGHVKKYAQGFTRKVRDGSATAIAWGKISESTRNLLMLNRELKSRLTKASTTKVSMEETTTNTMKVNAEIMQEHTKFSLFLFELKKISDGEPVEMMVEDEHGKHFVRVH
jgi:hypothetical protein